ncbi:hypothetical protein VTG60DRAFT_5782 [Thermothelomyces hinnuleus]
MAAIRTLLDRNANINLALPETAVSTPLMAAVLPADASRDTHCDDIDQAVRELVFRGADVTQTVEGSVFYTALSAACLGTFPGTIRFLLDEGASAGLADPVYGRTPLHFAAVNGIENFQALLLAYRGSDVMRPDKSGKTCLHWAAQYGNAETVRFILFEVAEDDAARRHYVSAADEDGWTPLCWAVRALECGWVKTMRSETPDHAAVVRLLIESGADARVECGLYDGDRDAIESLSPLTLASRSSAACEVVSVLEEHLQELRLDKDDDGTPVRRYAVDGITCDVCMAVSVGTLHGSSSHFVRSFSSLLFGSSFSVFTALTHTNTCSPSSSCPAHPRLCLLLHLVRYFQPL